MAGLIPAIGTRGVYTLLAPFENKLLPNVPYKCVAVRKLEDIVAAGGNPFTLYYEPLGLLPAVYDTDLAAGECIISLQSGAGSWVYVPTSYIASLPNQGGIPYTTMVLAVSLSAIPDSLDLTVLKQKMADTVTEHLGVSSEVKEVAVSSPTLLSQVEHDAIEAARVALITSDTTDYARYLAAVVERDALQLKVTELENYIISLAPPP